MQVWKEASDIGPPPMTSINGLTELSNSHCLVELQRQITTHNTDDKGHKQEE